VAALFLLLSASSRSQTSCNNELALHGFEQMAALALKTLRTKAGGPMEGEKHTHDAEFGRYSGYLPDAKGSHAAVSLTHTWRLSDDERQLLCAPEADVLEMARRHLVGVPASTAMDPADALGRLPRRPRWAGGTFGHGGTRMRWCALGSS